MESIYVVDDDSDDLLFVKSAFEKYQQNIRLQTFTNGRELLQQLDQPVKLPAFIILDLNMPIMAGIETLKVIRNTENLSKLNVIIFTTSNNPAERQETIEAGANDYICKPFTLEAYEKIADHLYRKWCLPVETISQ